MKVLVIRFSSIGDIVLTSPIVRALKQQLNAEVHFLTKKEFTGLVINNPNVATIHEYTDDNVETIKAKLKNENFDCIIDLHKNIRSKRIVKALKVKPTHLKS